MTFKSNAVMIPADLVDDLRRGFLDPATFGFQVANALGIGSKVDTPVDIRSYPDPVEEKTEDTLQDFFDIVYRKGKAIFPNHPQPNSVDVQNLLNLAKGDTSLVLDAIDCVANDQASGRKINRFLGLAGYHLKNTSVENIRRGAQLFRESQESSAELLVKQSLQETEEKLQTVTLDSGPDLSRMTKLERAVEERRRKHGITTPAG